MLTRTIAAVTLGFTLLVGIATSAIAEPITFNFTFAGNGATATGFITFESTLLPNPSVGNFIVALPNPAVLDLQVTVSGATAGNGTFGIASFTQVVWNTGGATLSLQNQLVGQPTPGSPWGTPNGAGGDFNLFGVAPTPNGTTFFTLSANGGAANAMVLSSMLQAVRAVPALDELKLVVLALLVGGVGLVLVRRRSSARAPG